MRRLVTGTVLFLVLVLLVLPTVMGRLLAGKGETVTAALPDGSDALPISVWFPETGRIQELPLGEYLKGVVAGEMPPEFADEALKAQFVVARTYAVRRMQVFAGPGRGGCPTQPAADVCADHSVSQAYMTREEALTQYGTLSANSYWKRLDRLQKETEGLVLRYEGQLIDPLYHSVSGRMTEDSGDYFSQSLPYLKPVDDRWGADSPKLMETRRFSMAQLATAISTQGDSLAVSALAGTGQPVQILTRTASGRVQRVKVGGITLTGREFRERLSLRSSDFRAWLQDGELMIQTLGYGHGVGMSQYGADGMARAGHGFQEILTHYYTGVNLTPLFGD